MVVIFACSPSCIPSIKYAQAMGVSVRSDWSSSPNGFGSISSGNRTPVPFGGAEEGAEGGVGGGGGRVNPPGPPSEGVADGVVVLNVRVLLLLTLPLVSFAM